MSAITKLFVVLLVICSLMMTSALVVFINRTEDYRKRYEATDNLRKQLDEQLASANQGKETANALFAKAVADMNNVKNNLGDKIIAKDQDIAKLNTTIAADGQNIALVQAQLSAAQEIIAQAQSTIKSDQVEIAAIRDQNNKVMSQNADLNLANTALTKQLQTVQTDLASAQEVIQNRNNEIRRLNDALTSAAHGLPSGGGTGAPGTPGGTNSFVPSTPIAGVIRSVETINEVPYAMISVGSNDRVQSGMKFTILDEQGNFMGFVTVTDVLSATEAAGRITGPAEKLSNIHKDMRVTNML